MRFGRPLSRGCVCINEWCRPFNLNYKIDLTLIHCITLSHSDINENVSLSVVANGSVQQPPLVRVYLFIVKHIGICNLACLEWDARKGSAVVARPTVWLVLVRYKRGENKQQQNEVEIEIRFMVPQIV